MTVKPDNICFIRTKLKRDYVFDGINLSGFNVLIPYRDYNLFMRICREAWIRLRLPYAKIWYNPRIRNITEDIIVVKDPLITADFMKELRIHNIEKRIIFDYDNRVARSINPEQIRKYVNEIWSYDQKDCDEYTLKKKGSAYFDVYRTKGDRHKKYDVFFIGRDKGRLSQLLLTEERMKAQGLITKFYICADREFLTWSKKIYKHFLPYEDYLSLLKKSRAILNIVPDGQTSITQREMEAVFDGVKCITNNQGIKEFPLYDDTRFFILNENYDDIKSFLNSEFMPIAENELEEYKFSNSVSRMLCGVNTGR